MVSRDPLNMAYHRRHPTFKQLGHCCLFKVVLVSLSPVVWNFLEDWRVCPFDFLEFLNSLTIILRNFAHSNKTEWKRPLGRHRCRWQSNIRMDLREIGWQRVDWIHLAQDRDQWQGLVNMVMTLRISERPLASEEECCSVGLVSPVLNFVFSWMIGGSCPGMDWEFFSSPPRPDRLWGPPILSSGYKGLFLWR
jgi:hypothetical protein